MSSDSTTQIKVHTKTLTSTLWFLCMNSILCVHFIFYLNTLAIFFTARQSRAHLIDFDQIESVGCKYTCHIILQYISWLILLKLICMIKLKTVYKWISSSSFKMLCFALCRVHESSSYKHVTFYQKFQTPFRIFHIPFYKAINTV